MDRIQLRRDTSARWAEINPILLEGEVGYEIDTKLRKIGDGVNRWNDLEYLKAEGISQETGNSQNITMSQDAITKKLSKLGSKLNVINAGKYSESTKYSSFADALQAIPKNVRIERAILYFTDNDYNVNVYIYISNSKEDKEWLTEEYWIPIYTGLQVDSLLNVIVEDSNRLKKRVDEVIEGQEQYNHDLERLDAKSESVIKEYNRLPIFAFFNGENSYAKINSITLRTNGDSFEAKVSPNPENVNSSYAFAYRDQIYNIGIGLSRDSFSIRTDDDLWIAQLKAFGTNKNEYIFKLSYEEDNMVVYIDGIEVFRYNEQKALTIGGFGQAASVSEWWKGEIGYVIINGIYFENIGYIEGFNGFNVEIRGLYGFLTEEQNKALKSIKPNLEYITDIFIEATLTKINVYVRIKDTDVFSRFEIVHTINNTDNTGQNGYCDVWGLYGDNMGMYRYVDGLFEKIPNTTLLIGAENEFTIQFEGMGDFTGGYHGDERIDLDETDYVEFVVDGKPYTIDDLVFLGSVNCRTFSYRQKSTMYASYVYNEEHKKIAEHLKETYFDNGGYCTRNFVRMEMSELGEDSIKVTTAFTGLVCPHRNFAKIIYGDDGKKYNATNPSVSVPLVNNINSFSRKVNMVNGVCSCVIDSSLINTSVDAWKDSYSSVTIMDRANDSKYYSYLKDGIIINDGDFLATECSVKFDIKM